MVFFGCRNGDALSPDYHKKKLSRAMKSEIGRLMKSMTIEEKSAQVLMTGIDGKDTFPKYLNRHFDKIVPGAILLFKYNIGDSPESVHAYLRSCTEAFSALKAPVPVLYAIDHEGGDVYRTGKVTAPLPSARSVAAHFSVAKAESLYRETGLQLAALGIGMNLAPVAETLSKKNAGFLGTRAYSDSGAVVENYVMAAMSGYRRSGVITALKHFPGNGTGDPHSGLPRLEVSPEVFASDYLEPFRQMIKKSPDVILVSHILIPSIDSELPFCLSRKGVTGVLRESLGFRGLILTDDIAMAALARNGYNSRTAAVLALSAGCDMIMTSDRDIRPIVDAIAGKARKDMKFAARLDQAVRRILELKAVSGLVKIDGERYSKSGQTVGDSLITKDKFDDKTFYAARAAAYRILEENNAN